ncbi:unnamed protein product [Arctogadus glacialis]
MEGRRQKPRRERLRTADDEDADHAAASAAPPCAGDTLPWNLSKLQRVKRSKSGSGEVLDPAERAVIRIAEQHNSTLMHWAGPGCVPVRLEGSQLDPSTYNRSKHPPVLLSTN